MLGRRSLWPFGKTVPEPSGYKYMRAGAKEPRERELAESGGTVLDRVKLLRDEIAELKEKEELEKGRAFWEEDFEIIGKMEAVLADLPRIIEKFPSEKEWVDGRLNVLNNHIKDLIGRSHLPAARVDLEHINRWTALMQEDIKSLEETGHILYDPRQDDE